MDASANERANKSLSSHNREGQRALGLSLSMSLRMDPHFGQRGGSKVSLVSFGLGSACEESDWAVGQLAILYEDRLPLEAMAQS
jgi:hypothetical protein